MRKRVIILCILTGLTSQLSSQNQGQPASTTDRIIDGGNLIIEILKVISSNEGDKLKLTDSKEADCASKNFTNVCFVNRSSRIIIVRLTKKESEPEHERGHELIIVNSGKECCYRVAPGVYTYGIGEKQDGQPDERLIRKGEVLLEACKDLEIKIK